MIRENNTLEWQEIAEQKRMTQRRIIQRRERARRRKRKVWRIRGLLLLFGCLLFLGGVRRFRQNPIQRYAKANGISMDQYPEELLSLYERNNETETFVEEYPLKKEEEPEKWQEFLEFNNHQLKELMSNYGTVDLLWFDGDWERSAAQWKMPEFREYLHTLNPNVVLNSRMQGYGDYETPEQGIPLYGPKGEWEFSSTSNDSLGYRPSDNDYKSSGQIVRMFCDGITMGGRMLLDIGPKEDGTLDERQEKVLLDLGGWIHDHKEAVFGTEKGLDYNHFLGGSTISADKKTMYLFVYDKPQETLCVKGIKTPVKRVTVLHTGEELRFSYTGSLPWSGIPGTLWIWAGEMSIHPFATVVKVELEDEITYNLGHGEVVTFNE